MECRKPVEKLSDRGVISRICKGIEKAEKSSNPFNKRANEM